MKQYKALCNIVIGAIRFNEGEEFKWDEIPVYEEFGYVECLGDAVEDVAEPEEVVEEPEEEPAEETAEEPKKAKK